MHVGRVCELWRYPVKSMRGDRLSSATVTATWGIPGDRGWAIRDEQASEIRGAKRISSLLQFHARYLDEPMADSTPDIEITFPDGSTMRSSDGRINEALSVATGRKVALWPRRPADDDHDHDHDHEHNRRSHITEVTPRGSYFDAMPLSLLTTTALDSLQATVPDSVIDPRRFRKNIIVTTERAADGFPEFEWVGRRLQIGELVCEVSTSIARCVMVGLPQADLPHDREILKSLARNTGMDLGVYLRVIEPGRIAEGDAVHLI